MKRIALLLGVLVALGAPMARAQNHAEVGAYVDYFRLHDTGSNFGGLGARIAGNITRNVQIEGDLAYDFNRVYSESFTNRGTGSVSVQNSNLKILHGMIGPKIQSSGPVRVFLTLKGGFMNFRTDPRPSTVANFVSNIEDIRSSNTHPTLYPGGGVEAFLGPIGLRLDVGDQIYYANGAHHNWSASFGPQLRF